MSRMMTAKQIVNRLKESATFIRDTLTFKQLATEEELAAYWPGGDENRDKGPMGWVHCYANYVRFCDRLSESAGEERDRGNDRIALEALSNQPVEVELESLGDSRARTARVYPKAFVALETIDRHDRIIGWLNEQREKLVKMPAHLAEAQAALEAVAEETIHQYSLIAWIATHPAPGVPESIQDSNAVIPEWITSLSPIDLLRIRGAFIETNIIRLHAVYALLETRTKGTNVRPSWATFFAQRSEESNGAVTTDTLMRDRALVQQVAAAMTAADARQKAIDESRQRES